MKNKSGTTLLAENIIFISLNLVFLAILITFIIKQGSGIVVLEQTYAKNIALLLDSVKPFSTITLNMYDAKKISDKNGIPFEEIVEVNGNLVTVRLSKNSGYTYAFFNDIDFRFYPNGEDYVFFMEGYK